MGRNVALTSRDEDFIATQIATGEFNNASEVVRAGLRLLEKEHLKLAELRHAVAEGDAAYARGESTTFTKPGQLAHRLTRRMTQGHTPDDN